MTQSCIIEQEIEEIQRQLTAKQTELGFVQQIEKIEQKLAEVERQKQLAEIELQRHQAQNALDAANLREKSLGGVFSPEPAVEPKTPENEPENKPELINRETAILVANVATRLRELKTDGSSFEEEADALIDRVLTEGTPAIRLLMTEFSLPYSEVVYRRTIKNFLKKQG